MGDVPFFWGGTPELAEYEIVKAATADDGYISTYYLTKNGDQVGAKINIPKDFLVKSASILVVDTADTPYEGAVIGDKYIDFIINVKEGSATDEHLYLPVNDLVDTYTSGSSVTDMVVIAIDNNKAITATIPDGKITAAKLEQTLQDKINATVCSENGANGLRYYNQVWQYFNGTSWVNMSLDDFSL